MTERHEERRCAHCGTVLAPHPNERSFRFRHRETCNRGCYARLKGQRAMAALPERACEACGTTLERRPGEVASNFRKRRSCSRACGYRLNGVARSIEPPARRCETCGAPLARRAREKTHDFLIRRTCGGKCRQDLILRRMATIRPTSIEAETYAALAELGITFEAQRRVERFMVDAFVSALNVVIECQGTFYHCDPRRYPSGPTCALQRANVERDRRKRATLERLGLRLIEVWESDIGRRGARAVLEEALLLQ